MSALAEFVKADCRDSFEDFLARMDWPQVSPFAGSEADRFTTWGGNFIPAHHRLMARAVQQCADGELFRVAVFMPPGSAKSTIVSGLAGPWLMGRFPGMRVMLASYGLGLARQWSRRARSVAASTAYRSIFPDAVKNRELWGSDHWGMEGDREFQAVGIDTPISGKRARALFIDDPIKSRKEAGSPTVLKTTREAYEDELTPRLVPADPGLPRGFVFAVFTRYGRNDMASWTLGEDYDGRSGFVTGCDGEKWLVICLPAIADRDDDPLGRAHGEGLWPERFPMSHWAPFQKTRRTWTSLYQQSPVPEGGIMFQRDWFAKKIIKPGQVSRDAMHCRGYDFAATEEIESPGADYTASVKIAKQAHRYIIRHAERARLTAKGVDDLMLANARADGVTVRVSFPQDPGQAGKDQAQRRAKMLQGRSHDVHTSVESGKKVIRAETLASEAEKGNVYLEAGDWNEDFLRELCEFPVSTHDDFVDAASRACNRLALLGSFQRVQVRQG